MMGASKNDKPGALKRLMGRIKHGLLIQEILDRMMRRGLVIYPYLVTAESSAAAGPPPESAYRVRPLGLADAAMVAQVTLRAITEASVASEMSRSQCFGIFDGERLAGYTWISTRLLPVPASRGVPLFELYPDESYLYDMFIHPEFRGSRMAPLLRSHVLQYVSQGGRSRCYSVTLFFNRSSRRFKARLGAKPVELRLYLHLRIGQMNGVDLRLWRRRPHLRTRWAQSVAPLRRPAPAAPETSTS